jgi:hypothetical protein
MRNVRPRQPAEPDTVRLFASTCALAFAISYIATYAASFYLERMPFTHQFFLASEWPGLGSNFDQRKYSFGVHYFGDFLATWIQSREGSPYFPGKGIWASNYPPFAHAIVRPLTILPYHLALTVFLITTVIALLGPAWYALRGRQLTDRLLILVVGVVLTYPFLLTLDRGNIQGIVGGLVMLGVLALLNNRASAAGVCFGLAGALKGYPFVFVLLLIGARRWRATAIAVTTMALTTFVPLMLFDGGPGANVQRLWETTGFFRQPAGASQAQQVFGNFSLLGLFASIRGLDAGLLSDFGSWFADNYSVIALALGIAAVWLIVGARATLLDGSVLAAVIAALLVPVSYGYVLVLFFAPLVLIFSGQTGSQMWATRTYAITLGLLFAPKGVTMGAPGATIGNYLNPFFELVLGVAAAGAVIAASRRSAHCKAVAGALPRPL